MTQKVIIPKGTINPGETNIIEIPSAVRGSNVLIAKPKEHHDSSSFGSGSFGSGGVSQLMSGGSGSYRKCDSSLSAPSPQAHHPHANIPSYESTPPIEYSDDYPPTPPDISWLPDERSFYPNYVMTPEEPFYPRYRSSPTGPPKPPVLYGPGGMKYMDSFADSAVLQKMHMLDQMEFVEQDQLVDDLRSFQKCRRRLIFDLAHMTMHQTI